VPFRDVAAHNACSLGAGQSLAASSCIPANLSPFGEIHRFEIKIGHPSESCRSEEFLSHLGQSAFRCRQSLGGSG